MSSSRPGVGDGQVACVLQSWGCKGWMAYPSRAHNLWVSGWAHSQGNSPVRCPPTCPSQEWAPAKLSWDRVIKFWSLSRWVMFLILDWVVHAYVLWSPSLQTDSNFPSWTSEWVEFLGSSTKFLTEGSWAERGKTPLNVSKLNCTWFSNYQKYNCLWCHLLTFSICIQDQPLWMVSNSAFESKTSH